MNASIEWQDLQGAAGPASEEIRFAVRRVTNSATFAKAPRMCALLSFLMEKKLGGEAEGLTEYAIGTQLFRRDPASYDTTIDPVVRVQVGRLRTRLADYYSAMKELGALQICIPPGSYVPALRRLAPAVPQPGVERLDIAPMRCLSLDDRNSAFAGGVDEELCSRMFLRFPAMLQVRGHSPFGIDSGAGAGARLRLEGSIRVEQEYARVSIRLIDNIAGHTAWSGQFDARGALGIARQEELADAICDKLADYFRSRTNAA